MTMPSADLTTAYRGSRALVLGASGFLGRWVARRLTQAHASVAVAVRDRTTFERIAERFGINADVFSLQALDELSTARVIQDADPDIVFNLIGYGVDRTEAEPESMWRINRDLVRHAALAVAQSTRAGRFVHVGTALEYGLLDGVATEESETDPHTLYGQSKLAGTNALRDVARETGLQAVTARAFTIFGAGEHPGRLLPTVRGAATVGTAVRLSSGAQRRDFCYVEDVAEGLLRIGASTPSSGEVVNLATGRLTSVREFAETAARVLGVPTARLEFGAEPVRSDEMRITGVSVERLKTLTGWAPPGDLESALVRALDFETGLTRQPPSGRFGN